MAGMRCWPTSGRRSVRRPANLAKQSAYSLLYAIPSMLIVLVSLAAIVDRQTGAGVSGALQRFIAEQAPEELQPLLASLVQYAIVETSEQAAIIAAIVSLVIAVWGGAGGVRVAGAGHQHRVRHPRYPLLLQGDRVAISG